MGGGGIDSCARVQEMMEDCARKSLHEWYRVRPDSEEDKFIQMDANQLLKQELDYCMSGRCNHLHDL